MLNVRERPFNTGGGSGKFGCQLKNKLQPPLVCVKKSNPLEHVKKKIIPSSGSYFIYSQIQLFLCFFFNENSLLFKKIASEAYTTLQGLKK